MLRASPRGTFQLILTDICMPELNGIELLQCIKKDEDLRSVPVVMMSSIDQEDTVFECVQRGAEEYLVKPVTRKEVVHMWQHVLRSRSAAATVPQAAGGVVVHAEAVQDAKSQKVNSTSKETSEMYCNSEKTFKCQMESNSTEDRTVEQTQTDVVGLQHVTINQLQDAELKMMQQFLHSMKSSRLQEAGELRSEIETLDLDVTEVRLLLEGKQQSSVEDASQSPQKKQRQMPLDERSAGALEQLYFQRRWRQSREGFLESLSKDIGVLARRSRLTVAASLRNGDMAIPQEMVSDAVGYNVIRISLFRFVFSRLSSCPHTPPLSFGLPLFGNLERPQLIVRRKMAGSASVRCMRDSRRACNSVGRVFASHAKSPEFDSLQVHIFSTTLPHRGGFSHVDIF